ncbi:MAG: hypothetical protein GY906_32440 [bacterium]|nr:hypothetical protein [bacterium]
MAIPVLLSAVLFFCCYHSEREIEGEGPVANVSFIDEREIFITARRDASLQDLVNLDVFTGFWPQMTFKEAREVFGEPADVGVERRTDTYFVYRVNKARVEIVKRRVSSEGNVWTSWVLRAIPDNSEPDSVLLPTAMKYVPEDVREVSVILIAGENGESKASVDLESGRITRIFWLR